MFYYKTKFSDKSNKPNLPKAPVYMAVSAQRSHKSALKHI